VWWQNEGNSAADAEKYSAALQLWDQAIALTPSRPELHEQKAQVGPLFVLHFHMRLQRASTWWA